MKNISYWFNKKLYLTVTAQRWTKHSLLQLKGPSFHLPKEAEWVTTSDYEPTAEELVKEVDDAFSKELIGVNSMKSDEITFGGIGDPLCRLDSITEAARTIKESRHGVPLRLMTFGLVPPPRVTEVVASLKESGIKNISVSLLADNPMVYNDLVGPTQGRAFTDVLNFITIAAENGLTVTCTAVEKPGINIGNVRSLALSLGAMNFSTYKYQP
jgi:TatD family-associated radical SAM protein